jgi:hypothetical protein
MSTQLAPFAELKPVETPVAAGMAVRTSGLRRVVMDRPFPQCCPAFNSIQICWRGLPSSNRANTAPHRMHV